MKSGLRKWILASVVSPLLLAAASSSQADYLSDAGMGVLTLGSNVLYVPAKLSYAVLGGVTGSFAYVLTGSNYQVAERIWTPSIGGDYVLTTDHLRGQETIRFSSTTPSAWEAPNP